MKQLALVVMFFPLLAFIVAGVIELRSQRRVIEKLGSVIPIVLGVAAFALLFGPAGWFLDIRGGWPPISRAMTMVSAVIACSGIFLPYSRRASAIWVACGGLLLAFIWMFNRTLA
jgi:hypothetical protein